MDGVKDFGMLLTLGTVVCRKEDYPGITDPGSDDAAEVGSRGASGRAAGSKKGAAAKKGSKFAAAAAIGVRK